MIIFLQLRQAQRHRATVPGAGSQGLVAGTGTRCKNPVLRPSLLTPVSTEGPLPHHPAPWEAQTHRGGL